MNIEVVKGVAIALFAFAVMLEWTISMRRCRKLNDYSNHISKVFGIRTSMFWGIQLRTLMLISVGCAIANIGFIVSELLIR